MVRCLQERSGVGSRERVESSEISLRHGIKKPSQSPISDVRTCPHKKITIQVCL